MKELPKTLINRLEKPPDGNTKEYSVKWRAVKIGS